MNISNLKELDLQAIGDRIKNERKNRKWTRETFAENAALTPRYIAQIEQGERKFSMDKFYNIVQVLDVSADYLLMGKNNTLEDYEKERLKEAILEPLKNCNMAQLRCMERISRSYVQGLAAKDEE